jgi:hypothetical protein
MNECPHHQNAGQNHGTKIINISFETYDTVQAFGNESSKSKFDSRGC